MTALHATNRFNVEATLNKWLFDSLAAITLPSWITSYSFVQNMPESELKTPSFSVHHFQVSNLDLWQGRNAEVSTKAVRAVGLMEINIWVNRDANTAWNAQLRFMEGMVDDVYVANPTVVIDDYVNNTSAPDAVTYKIDLGNMNKYETAPDLNPNIMRRRMQIRYEWSLRS